MNNNEHSVDRSISDRNTGHYNMNNNGNKNSGDRNTGHRNTGDFNTGHRNTGNWNTGDRNTGDWNTCNKEAGFFNTIQADTIRVFNKPCPVTVWENATKPKWLMMTEQEKNDNPSYVINGGYCKVMSYKEAAQHAWNKATEEDKQLTFALPNFDAKVFYEIFGIDVRS